MLPFFSPHVTPTLMPSTPPSQSSSSQEEPYILQEAITEAQESSRAKETSDIDIRIRHSRPFSNQQYQLPDPFAPNTREIATANRQPERTPSPFLDTPTPKERRTSHLAPSFNLSLKGPARSADQKSLFDEGIASSPLLADTDHYRHRLSLILQRAKRASPVR